MSLRSKYARAVRRTMGSGYHAAWYPDTVYRVGAYGRMDDDVFVAFGDLQDLNIPIEVDQDTMPSALEINMSRGVSITAKAKGTTNADVPHVPEASVGLGIEFKAEGAFTISAEKVFEDRLRNPGGLETQLRELQKEGKWDSSYRIVTGILRMPIATILISQNANTKVELSLEGTLTPAIKELGKAEVTGNVNWESSGIMKYAPAQDAVPIIQLHRLQRRFLFGPPRLRVFGMTRVDAPGSAEEWCLDLDDELPSPVD